jgi:DNA polymerase
MFVGEAPGGEEDQQGRPFVGAAGQLLTRMIEAMGLTREEVYICNIIKCRPPRNRDPNPDEIDTCEPFLRDQIDAIEPSIIIALGSFAARTLLRTETSITRLRGRFHTYHGIALMPTFHPAYLLRNAAQKRPVWQDLKAVMAEMDRLGLDRRRG